jgi:hypothetical protein
MPRHSTAASRARNGIPRMNLPIKDDAAITRPAPNMAERKYPKAAFRM